MRLSPHDLEQMDEAYLRNLEPEALRAVSERLLQALKEFYERLRASHCAALPAAAPLEIRLGFYTLDLELGTAAQPGLRVLGTLPYDGDTTCPCGPQTRTQPTLQAIVR